MIDDSFVTLEHVNGKPRRGKTSYVVARVLNEDLKYINERYYLSCEYIKDQNKTLELKRSFPPQRHVVSANFKIKRIYPNMESYDISGFEFGVPNPYCSVKPLIPYGVYVFDEAQKYFDSKGEKELPPWVTQAFEWRGHIFLKIYLISQRVMRLNVDIRDTVDIFTYIEKSTHTYIINGKKVNANKFLDYGKLIKTVWSGRRFESADEEVAYIKGDKTLGEPFKYEFFGNIKEHYNPHNYAVNVEDLSKDFKYYDYQLITNRPKEWDDYKKLITKKKE